MGEKKKNVLMICTDHWAGSYFRHTGCDVYTPTLDYLSEAGIEFRKCYSECPVCIPARRTLMTGLVPRHHKDRVYSDRMEMPDVPTLAQCFRDNGYQAYAVGKLHVYPQRNRIGFDDVILAEEGRYEFGETDDYQIWLGEKGHVGEEFLHSMGNNNYLTRPWHLDEELHPTSWVTKNMMKMIKRKDPTRPAFFYCSYMAPHPPLVPLQSFIDMYKDKELQPSIKDDWEDSYILKALRYPASRYSEEERIRARKAFYALCTQIDYEIRLLIGTLRECSLLDDTIIVFISDHGDMLFDHDMVAKRLMYDNSARIPLIFAGKPVLEYKGKGYENKLATMSDVMPTLLDMCGIEVPEHVDGFPLFSDNAREYVYGEVSNGEKATRMIRDNKYKLIYYPCGNIKQLFDMENDPHETHDLSSVVGYESILSNLESKLISELYDTDLEWIKEGKLVGFEAPKDFKPTPDFGLYNQRGYHWPQPKGYSNKGKNA